MKRKKLHGAILVTDGADPQRNSNGNADASKGSKATQALQILLPSFEIHSEVYNTDERARLQTHASEIIASLMKASLFFEGTLRGNAIISYQGRVVLLGCS